MSEMTACMRRKIRNQLRKKQDYIPQRKPWSDEGQTRTAGVGSACETPKDSRRTAPRDGLNKKLSVPLSFLSTSSLFLFRLSPTLAPTTSPTSGLAFFLLTTERTVH